MAPEVIEQALARAGLAEAAGLGPENPLADIAALAALAGTIILSSDTPQAPVPASMPNMGNDALATADNAAYKSAYLQRIPPNSDPCEVIEQKIAKERALIASRNAWDAKHWDAATMGPMLQHIRGNEQAENAIKNLEKRLAECKKKCPQN